MKGVIKILNAMKSEIVTNIWFYKIVLMWEVIPLGQRKGRKHLQSSYSVDFMNFGCCLFWMPIHYQSLLAHSELQVKQWTLWKSMPS